MQVHFSTDFFLITLFLTPYCGSLVRLSLSLKHTYTHTFLSETFSRVSRYFPENFIWGRLSKQKKIEKNDPPLFVSDLQDTN